MSVTAVVGLQWGDEGKGKTVDELGEHADIVVRAQGGDNAGHTVVVGKEVFKLHLLPSGAVRERLTCVIGNGLVVNPLTLVQEIEKLESRGISILPRLFLSDRAHILFPYHRVLDTLREKARGKESIGTTGRGIGPCYVDKVNRTGLRWHHARDPELFAALFHESVLRANATIQNLGGEPLDPKKIAEEVLPAIDRLRPRIYDTVALLHQALETGKNILLEGAQGTMLDIDFGTYPYLTSSNTTVGGLATGTGIPPSAITHVHGILKGFTTRVGSGPFPTEVGGDLGVRLRGTGENQWDEFGTTTGRPRRCGWLDLVVGRYSVRLNGVTHLHITKLDILSQFDEIKVCVGYQLNGKEIQHYPASIEDLSRCQPIYETFVGWKKDLQGCHTLSDLPPAAQKYLDRIQTYLGVPIASVSYGPGRNQTLRAA